MLRLFLLAALLLLAGRLIPATSAAVAAAAEGTCTLHLLPGRMTPASASGPVNQASDAAALLLGGPMMPMTTSAALDDVVAMFDVVAQVVGVIIGLFVTINTKMIISRCFGRKLIIAFVLVFIFAHTKSQEIEDPLVRDIVFEDDWGDEAYNIYIVEVKNSLGSTTEEWKWDTEDFSGENHFILPETDRTKVHLWVKVRVKGDSGKYVFLLFKADTAYLVGFINEYGTYCVQEASVFFPNGCTELPFGDTYRELFHKADPSKSKDDASKKSKPKPNDDDDNDDSVDTKGDDDICKKEEEEGDVNINPFLGTIHLGRSAMRVAASTLADYQHDPNSTPELLEPVRKAILVFVLMTSEAVRFKPIGHKCRSTWIPGGFLSPNEYELAFLWKNLSILWCRGDKKSPWTRCGTRIEELGIKSLAEIDAILDVVKYSKYCKDKRVEKGNPEINQ